MTDREIARALVAFWLSTLLRKAQSLRAAVERQLTGHYQTTPITLLT